jgi:hypothetical protein
MKSVQQLRAETSRLAKSYAVQAGSAKTVPEAKAAMEEGLASLSDLYENSVRSCNIDVVPS